MSKVKLIMLVLGSLLINNTTLHAADEENNSQGNADQNLFDSNGSNEDTKTAWVKYEYPCSVLFK